MGNDSTLMKEEIKGMKRSLIINGRALRIEAGIIPELVNDGVKLVFERDYNIVVEELHSYILIYEKRIAKQQKQHELEKIEIAEEFGEAHKKVNAHLKEQHDEEMNKSHTAYRELHEQNQQLKEFCKLHGMTFNERKRK